MNSRVGLHIISQPSESLRGLTRREVVQRLLTGIGAALATPLAAGAHPVVRHVSTLVSMQAGVGSADANWSPQFLSAKQNEVLVAISDRMLPGAAAAHVNRTIDLLMTVESEENRNLLTQALDALDAQAENQFHSAAVKLTPDQIDEVLSYCAEQEPPHAEHDDDAPGWKLHQRTPLTGAPNLRDHFEYLKGWIVASYYSSEAGLRELGWNDDYYFQSPKPCKHVEGYD
jgi:hypothetical protein